MAPVLKNDEIQKLSFGDALLIGIEWREDADFVLRLRLPKDETIAEVLCRYATNLEITLTFGDLIGAPLTWAATFTPNDQGWHIEFDFAGAPKGAIALDCNDVQIAHRDVPKAG
jgi:hypothetical protein